MKTCPKGHENPDHAKYCRICGCKLKKYNKNKVFTPDVFPHINLIPKSMFKRLSLITGSLFLLFLLGALFSTSDIQVICYILAAVFGLILAVKETKFLLNIDYVESDPIRMDKKYFYRVAKKGKMGLYNKKKKRIVLKSKYDDINVFGDCSFMLLKNEKVGLYNGVLDKMILPVKFDSIMTFDENHLLITEGARNGLFSISLGKIIVPVEYDSFGSFDNFMIDAHLGDIVHHYDIKGHLMN